MTSWKAKIWMHLGKTTKYICELLLAQIYVPMGIVVRGLEALRTECELKARSDRLQSGALWGRKVPPPRFRGQFAPQNRPCCGTFQGTVRGTNRLSVPILKPN